MQKKTFVELLGEGVTCKPVTCKPYLKEFYMSSQDIQTLWSELGSMDSQRFAQWWNFGGFQRVTRTCVYKIRNPSKISNSERWTTSETNNSLQQVKASGAYQACCSLPEQRSELRKAVTQLWGNSDPLPHCPDATLTQTLIDSYQAARHVHLNLIFIKIFFKYLILCQNQALRLNL